MKRIGLWGARADDTGLGIQTYEFYQHIKPYKTLVVTDRHECFYDRYPDAIIIDSINIPIDIIRKFLYKLDVVMTFETPYNWDAFRIAKEMGIKTILQPNYEWWPENPPCMPDLLLPPSTWYFDKFPEPKICLPAPINRELIKFRLRKKAKTFLHIAGQKDTSYGRNGTREVFDAIPLVKSDVRFVIYSQDVFDNIPNDRRLDYRFGSVSDYSKLYNEGDVLVYPRRYGGQSLQLNEAMASGMAIIMTDIKPQNKFLPKELLIKPKEMGKIKIFQEVEIATVRPIDIAKKIDEIANKDISLYSKHSDMVAEQISWKTLLPKYKEILCQN